MISRPCPCGGCTNGRHASGKSCRYCGGKGFMMEHEGPMYCPYWSESTHPHPRSTRSSNPHEDRSGLAKVDAPTPHVSPGVRLLNELADRIDQWLPSRNALSAWEREHWAEYEGLGSAVGTTINELLDMLDEATAADASEDGNRTFLLNLSRWWALNSERMTLLITDVNATDEMLQSLRLTGPARGAG